MGSQASKEKIETVQRVAAQYENLSAAEVEEYYDVFLSLSESRIRDGVIDRDEFHDYIGAMLGFHSESPFFKGYFDVMDADGDQVIDFDEFIGFIAAFKDPELSERGIELTFRVIDANGDGFIQKSEYLELLKQARNVSACETDRFTDIDEEDEFEAEDLFEELVGDPDGQLSREDFKKLLRAKPELVNMFRGK